MTSMEIDLISGEIATLEGKENNLIQEIIHFDSKKSDEETLKRLENEVFAYASILSQKGKTKELANLIRYIRPFLANISKAKAAKMVQTLVDKFIEINAATGIEVNLCKECIEWAKEEKRIFLRQQLEAKLLSVYFENKQYEEGLLLSTPLLKELKKMDDKNLLVEVQLIESKIYHSLGNLPKSRAALTSARTTANGIYCPPKMQGALDLQSGIVHASEDKDFKTAYSYFYEAFEGYETCGFTFRPKTLTALKYMLIAKIMLNNSEEVESLIMLKLNIKYGGRDLDAVNAIAVACKNRSLLNFEKARREYKAELTDDPVIKMLLETLYDKLLESNMVRIIEPYSRVQIEHVAKSIQMPRDLVEKKLSQMILDEKFNGIIDQSDGGILIIFPEKTADRTFDTAINIIECMSKVMDTLYAKAQKLN